MYNPLKISRGNSFVMRMSPVRVREVAQKDIKVRKCLKTNMLEKSSLFVFAFICLYVADVDGTKYTRIGTDLTINR